MLGSLFVPARPCPVVLKVAARVEREAPPMLLESNAKPCYSGLAYATRSYRRP